MSEQSPGFRMIFHLALAVGRPDEQVGFDRQIDPRILEDTRARAGKPLPLLASR
jgi:hypothetical protein